MKLLLEIANFASNMICIFPDFIFSPVVAALFKYTFDGKLICNKMQVTALKYKEMIFVEKIYMTCMCTVIFTSF